MKIVQIITSLETGGAEKLVVDLSKQFSEKLNSVDVISLSNKKTPFWYDLENTNKIVGLTEGSVYNPLLIFKLIPYLSKYDIIQVHLFPALYWVVLAKWISFNKAKIFYTEHSTNNKRRSNFLFKIFDRIIYRGINKIITIADEVDVNLKNHLNFQEHKFYKIYNGVNVEKFLNADVYNKSEFFNNTDFTIIQVSSFRYPKDQSTIIRALTLLPESVKLILVGDGPNKFDCQNLCIELNVADRVLFLGIRMDVPSLLKMCDVIALSSYHEGLSISNLEGMSVNKPFIGSNVQGIREVVENYGLLFERGDYIEFSELILKLMSNKDFYFNIANKCLSRAKQFDESIMINEYLKIYSNNLK